MVIRWDSEADAKLFAAVIATSEVKLDYSKLAAIMGPECTPKAVTHRITKLREIAKNFDPNAAAMHTPVKRGRKTKAKAAQSDDEDDDEESPTKKPKTTKSKKGPKVKLEPDIKDDVEGGESPGQAEEKSSDDE